MKNKLQETVNALVLAKGSKSDAARSLNIPRTTFISRLESAERAGIKPTVKSPNLEVALAEQKMVSDLQIRDLKKQLEESIQQNVTSDYASTKTGEVVSALKRDPKVRKRFEKAAKKEGGKSKREEETRTCRCNCTNKKRNLLFGWIANTRI